MAWRALCEVFAQLCRAAWRTLAVDYEKQFFVGWMGAKICHFWPPPDARFIRARERDNEIETAPREMPRVLAISR